MAHGLRCVCRRCIQSSYGQSNDDYTPPTTEERSTDGHSGGWREAQHGYINNRPVTFALGWGTKEGEVLLADGHVSTRRPGSFWDGGHNHYGKGQGPNANVKDRGMYTGPGA